VSARPIMGGAVRHFRRRPRSGGCPELDGGRRALVRDARGLNRLQSLGAGDRSFPIQRFAGSRSRRSAPFSGPRRWRGAPAARSGRRASPSRCDGCRCARPGRGSRRSCRKCARLREGSRSGMDYTISMKMLFDPATVSTERILREQVRSVTDTGGLPPTVGRGQSGAALGRARRPISLSQQLRSKHPGFHQGGAAMHGITGKRKRGPWRNGYAPSYGALIGGGAHQLRRPADGAAAHGWLAKRRPISSSAAKIGPVRFRGSPMTRAECYRRIISFRKRLAHPLTPIVMIHRRQPDRHQLHRYAPTVAKAGRSISFAAGSRRSIVVRSGGRAAARRTSRSRKGPVAERQPAAHRASASRPPEKFNLWPPGQAAQPNGPAAGPSR